MLGMSAWKSGDLGKAEKAFDKVTAIDPTNLKAHLNAARVLLDLNRDQEGLERVQKALTLDSTSLDGLRVLARAETKLGRYDDAVATYRQALIRDDQDVWTLNNLGMLYLELGDGDVALGPLARAVQLKSSSPVFQNNLGIALERAGYRVAAKQAYEAAVRADSTYGKAIGNLQRISAVVTDTTKDEPVNLKKVADLFRLEIGMWRDSATKTETPVTPPAKADSLPPTEL
jgi:tetratricopeptide (TPR) repeat protein